MDVESLQNNDPLKHYLRELSTFQLLTKNEENELRLQARNNGDLAERAKRRLIESKLGLVVAISERYVSSGRPILDLIEA
jgi:DNA-directed RNA polymerase sigma subunit (sigma70/sigma32)